MLSRRVLTTLGQHVLREFRRNIGVTAIVTQAATAKLDPIQQLFVQKIHEYGEKSKSAGGKLVDATSEVELAYQKDIEKVDKFYNAQGVDMTKFPAFEFLDPELQAVGLGAEAKPIEAEVAEVEETKEENLDNVPYYDV